MIAPARLAAFDVLREVDGGTRTLPDALARATARLSDERDRALAAEVSTGTLRWQGALDHVVARLASRPLAEVDRDILVVLRLSAYQLRHLERVPASAVVHDAVELTRHAGRPAATRFVNALLRNLASHPARVSLPPRPPVQEPGRAADTWRTRALDYLSITLSHPRWLVSRWLDRLGFERAEAWCRFNNGHAPLTLRANTLKTTRDTLVADLASEGVATEPARHAPDGLIVTFGQPLRTPLWARGAFLVQDEASQLVALLASARPGEVVLDTCAAPGGKTVTLAAAMADTGRLVAVDVRARRMRLLARTVRESGATCVRLVQADGERGLPFRAGFDCVFVDAPCSGLGTVRRDPEIKWRRSEADLPGFAARQGRLLAEAATHVRPGGRLVYATCSSEPDENDDVVAAFLTAHPEYGRIDPRTAAAQGPLVTVVEADGTFRTDPARDGLEAFYGVTMRRRSD